MPMLFGQQKQGGISTLKDTPPEQQAAFHSFMRGSPIRHTRYGLTIRHGLKVRSTLEFASGLDYVLALYEETGRPGVLDAWELGWPLVNGEHRIEDAIWKPA